MNISLRKGTLVLINSVTLLISLSIGCLSHSVYAQDSETGRVLFLLSSKGEAYLKVRDSIFAAAEQATALSRYSFETLILDEAVLGDAALGGAGRQVLIIPVGAAAARYARDAFPHTPVFSVFVTADAYRSLSGDRDYREFSALFIDQPYSRYLILASILNPHAKRVAMAIGPSSRNAQAELEQQAAAFGLEASVVYIDTDADPIALLNPVMLANDIFLALPDTAVINRASSRWILYLSYRHKVPVLGFSRSYADAGAAAAVYVSAQDIGEEAVLEIEQWLKRPGLGFPQARYHRNFSVSLNSNVIKSLGLEMYSPERVVAEIRRKEQDRAP